MEENKIFKDSLITVNVSAKAQPVENTNITIYSHDIESAKIDFQLVKNKDQLPLTSASNVEFVLKFKDAKAHITATIEDRANGLISMVMPQAFLGYVGNVTGGIFIKYSNGQSLDCGYFIFKMKLSLIDEDVKEISGVYVETFESLRQEILERSGNMNQQLNEMDDNISVIEEKISKNDVVTKLEYTENKNNVAELLAQTMMELVNINSFGVVGNGVSSDKTAFQNAINHVVSNNLRLYIPNGTYNLDSLEMILTKPLKIVGQSRDGVVLKNLKKLTLNSDLSLKNMTVLDIVGDNAFEINLTSFATLHIENVKSDNTDYNFTGKTRANRFVSYVNANATQSSGLSWVDIKNCEIKHFASYAFYLQGYVVGGEISYNRISEIGYDTNRGVAGIFGGYQATGNVITGSFENVEIKGNTFRNLYTAYGQSDDYAEGHAIIGYGNGIKVRDNIIKNIYGGGRTEAHLNCGGDHEAIYFKASDIIISDNFIENASGDLSEGAICVKGSTNVRITGNTIKGLYGTGILTNSVSDVDISDNFVVLDNPTQEEPASNVYCVSSSLDRDDAREVKIKNNRLINKRPKRTGTNAKSCCVGLNITGIATIENNFLESHSDKIIHCTSAGQYSANIDTAINIDNNKIIVGVNTLGIEVGMNYGNALLSIKGNEIITYSSKDIILGSSYDTNNSNDGIYEIKNNRITYKGINGKTISLYNAISFTIEANIIAYSDLSSVNSYAIYIRLRSDGTDKRNDIYGNLVTGSIMKHFTYIEASAYKIGDIIVRDNTVDLTDGRLVHPVTILDTSYLGIFNNVVKSALSPNSIIDPAKIAVDKLFQSGNISR